MPVPPRHDFSHYRGDSFGAALFLWADTAHTEPTVLNGAAVNAQVRIAPDATDILTSFDVVTEGNQITLTLTPEQTAALPASAVYDVQLDWAADGSRIQTVLAGGFTVAADVTRLG